jgi:predicted RNase H-like HicB family nuclease
MATKKEINHYVNLNWSYTIEQETGKGKHFYIIRVNELPGICTDAKTIEEGMKNILEAIEATIILYLENGKPIPEPIKKEGSGQHCVQDNKRTSSDLENPITIF